MTYLEELKREIFFKLVVEEVDKIDVEVPLGGPLCRHTRNGGASFWFILDREGGGKSTIIDYLTYIEADDEEGKRNPKHIGCLKRAGRWKVEGGTYVVIGADITISTKDNAWPVALKIIVTPQADMRKVIEMARQRLGCI